VPLVPLVAWLLPMGGREFGRAAGRTAINRAGRHRLLRNAIAALANAGELPVEAVELLVRATRDARPEVRAQAELALAATGGVG
jgi:epoxyqueuosine reductase QueG